MRRFDFVSFTRRRRNVVIQRLATVAYTNTSPISPLRDIGRYVFCFRRQRFKMLTEKRMTLDHPNTDKLQIRPTTLVMNN